MKSILAIGAVLIVLLGVFGIPVYTHTCLHEDLTIVSVFTPSDHCEEVACEEPKQEASCCEQEKSEEEEINGNCCADDLSDVRLHLSYFEEFLVKWQLAYPEQEIIAFADVIDREAVIQKSIGIVQTHAPPIDVGQYLPLICIWRL